MAEYQANKAILCFCNLVWFISCLPAYISFLLNRKRLSKVQYHKLFTIIHHNKNTAFGKKHKFAHIRSYDDWNKLVPINEYEDFIPYIKKIKNGAENILTAYPVLLLEPTSGSTGKSKYIPYTKELKKEFQRAISCWIADIFLHNYTFLSKQSYWAISPQAKADIQNTPPIKIGFNKDSEYLSGLSQYLMKTIMATPKCFTQTKEMFIKNKNIGLISIWSPSFLDCIFQDDTTLTKKLKNIKFVSAWGDGHSKNLLPIIKKYLPNAFFQPKGLLSTECFTSFPLYKTKHKAVLAYQSHFFEFMDEQHNICLADDVVINKEYTIVATTSGGLYRYNTHDKVKIVGFYHSIPLIEFIERDNCTADFLGEKLNAQFVENACQTVFKKLKVKPIFYTLTFAQKHYRLLIDGINLKPDIIANLLENELEKNFHYKNCIEIKQLKKVDCLVVENGIRKYIDFYVNNGFKEGDIKFKVIDLEFQNTNKIYK